MKPISEYSPSLFPEFPYLISIHTGTKEYTVWKREDWHNVIQELESNLGVYAKSYFDQLTFILVSEETYNVIQSLQCFSAYRRF